jgi:hypothetical protein
MARPYFTGDYGSALARVDTRPIIEAGRAQGQMYANMGAQIGGMIQQYGLNKVKRAKLTGEIEAHFKENPEALSQIGMTGDEAQDKKDLLEREKFMKGDMSMAQLEGYAGKLARGEVLRSKKLQDQSRIIQNQLGEQNLGLRERLEDSQVENAQLRNVYQGLANDLIQLSKDRTTAIQGHEITAIINKYTDDEGLRQIKNEIAGEEIIQQGAALKADPLVDQVKRQRVREEQSIKKNQLMLDAYEASESKFPAGERAKLERKKLKNDIRFKKLYMQGFSSARGATPISIDLQKNLADAQKELDRLSSQKTKYKDDDDNPLNVSDLLEVKADRTIGLIEGYDMDELDRVTKNNVQLFLAQSAKVENAQKQIPVAMQGTVSLTEFGNKPPEIGEIIDFNGQQARVIGITNGVVTVNYEGTLHDKNRLDLQAQELEEAARLEEQRNLIPQIRSDFERAGGSARFGQSKL